MDELVRLINKEVIVEADGIIYRGKLIEVTEQEVYLKSEFGWLTIQMDKISSIKAA